MKNNKINSTHSTVLHTLRDVRSGEKRMLLDPHLVPSFLPLNAAGCVTKPQLSVVPRLDEG